MTCRGLIARLGELSCRSLAPRASRQVQRHLAGCESCGAYGRSYMATIELAREAFRAPAGADMPEALVGKILAAAQTKFSRFSPRAGYLVHLLAGVAAGPLLAFCLR